MLRKFLRKPVRILGRSFSMAAILAFVIVLGVAAWGAYHAIDAYMEATVSFGAPPDPIEILDAGHDCILVSGSGARVNTGTWTAGTYTYSCEFTGVEDDTVAEMQIRFSIPGGRPDVHIDAVSLPTNPCLTPTNVNGPVTASSGTPSDYLTVRFSGNPATINCAGQASVPFDVVLSAYP